MKYYGTSKFPKTVGNVGFFSIIAICLVLIGAITWFAVSKYNNATEKQSPTPQISEPKNTEPDTTITEPEPNVQSAPTPVENSAPAQTSEETVPYEEVEEAPKLTLPKGKIIKNHSDTELQYSATYGDMRLHKGIDIELALGSEVAATAKGKVSEILDDALLGKCVTVEYSGNITVKYCGFDTLAVSDGEEFSAGRVLGTAGTVPSECADNSHLHIEVKKDGKTVEPLSIFKTE